jgi:hypothetical protein
MWSTTVRVKALLAASSAVLTAAACLATAGTAQAHGRTDHSPRPAHAGGVCSSSVRIAGFSDALDKTTFGGSPFIGISDLAVDEHGTLDALSDRSALFTLKGHTLDKLQPEKVTELADEKGQPLDSEALVIDRDGTRLVTSEVEPSIRRYSHDGSRILDRLPVPQELKVAPAGRSEPNSSFEGLAFQHGGRTLVASMESALADDDRNTVRFQTWQRTGKGNDFELGPQYAYRVDTDDSGSILGVSDLADTGDGRMLVVERSFTAGVGNTVRLYLTDFSGATDVSHVDRLTGQKSVRPLHKTLLADIADCPTLGATAKEPQPTGLLDNIEAMAVTGHAPGGRLRVLLASDDNANPVQITRFYDMTVKLPKH